MVVQVFLEFLSSDVVVSVSRVAEYFFGSELDRTWHFEPQALVWS